MTESPMSIPENAGLLQRFRLIAADIKLSHSIFALPFALWAGFMAPALDGRLPTAAAIALVVACMVTGRTFAMTVNRWADAGFDAANPRTAGRAVPSGRLGAGGMLSAATLSGLLFILAAAMFWLLENNIWPLLLSPLVLAWLAGYSFTKRFTWACHLMLGAALAVGPLAAAVAVHPPAVLDASLLLLAMMVLCWVAGFDVLYALQDVEVDRRDGLFSIPASLGPAAAVHISRGLHAAAVAALALMVWISPLLGWITGAAVLAVALLLLLEHLIIRQSGTKRLHLAFFTLNAIVSLLLGAAGIVDVWLSI